MPIYIIVHAHEARDVDAVQELQQSTRACDWSLNLCTVKFYYLKITIARAKHPLLLQYLVTLLCLPYQSQKKIVK